MNPANLGTHVREPNLGELVTDLQEAEKALERAQQECSIARNKECDCRNKLNSIQKKIDEEINKLKQKAPRESDWKNDIKGKPIG